MTGVGDTVVEAAEGPGPAQFSVLKQRVDLDVDFVRQSLKGSTEITVQPLVKELRQIRLHCRQCKLTSVQAGGITAKYEYEDPYRRRRMPTNSTVHQHEMLKEKIVRSLQPAPQPELTITLPPKLKIQELHVDPVTALPQYSSTPSLQKQEEDAMAIAETPTITSAIQPQAAQFAPIKLFLEFEVDTFRDGIHWVGCDEGDRRYPYMFTTADPLPGKTSCIFPCVDNTTSRCSWELSVRCPRSVGDAFRKPAVMSQQPALTNGDIHMTVGEAGAIAPRPSGSGTMEYMIDLSEEDAALDLTVVAVGEQVDDIVDADDETRHTVSFSVHDPVTARHIGFAIGPFERVDLSSSRDANDEERLGQRAVKVDGFCLPGRADEVRNTCFPVTRIIDYFGVNFTSFPFSGYRMVFVDDFVPDVVALAGLSICSSRLLFPEDVIEPLETNTRIIIRTVAEQWAGVSVIPKTASDTWVVSGIAGYMADLYGKTLFGNNAYRWQQKLAAEKVYELDADRPSVYEHGQWLHLDPSIREFLNLKSALVLFILDRRLLKASGTTGVQRVINKILVNATTGTLENGELSTADFQRQCEKLGHNKLESFFKQWVFGAGCPIFQVSQRFNKKKLVVEMTIVQRQMERKTKPPFAPNNFMREIKEHVQEVWAPETLPVFTGPMTIRIHEADGTPYEHIVEIKEQMTKLEIPYNTKYKRLKRSRRQKDRAMAEGTTGEGGEEALLYCLGDILDSPEECQEWRLVDWAAEDEERMGQESYEWIRMDADFEWIGKIHLTMPLYMYVSQLQQDRDLVAQYDSMRYLTAANAHQVSFSILVRTLMDRRYFHGIRSMAAEGLAVLAANAAPPLKGWEQLKETGEFHLRKAFNELFCFPGETMPKPNDWSDRTNFIIQCAIPRAMAKLRDADGKVPLTVRQFFMDKLRFNDNSDNPFSDCHYVATLMGCLADSLVVSHREPSATYTFNFGEDEPMEPENPDEPFERDGINAIERFRRIDEWETTYHNIYSLTALECLQKLSKAGMAKDKTAEVLQYTRASNADLVRVAAFRCLIETGLARRMTMIAYLLHCIADEPSPYVRNRFLACFGEALGHLALGDPEPAAPPPRPTETDGLVLEQEASSDARQFETIRKTTPDGAIAALKSALSNEDMFKQALWYAATSPDLTIDEAAGLCDVAALLYPAIASRRVTMKLPRMYRTEHLGNGKMRFYQHGPVRTAPRKLIDLDDLQSLRALGLKYTGPAPEEVVTKARQESEPEISLKLQLQQARQQSMGPPALPTPTTEKGPIKLTFGAMKRKASVDVPSGGRSASPKAPKTSLLQTANAAARAPSPPRRSPSVASQRRDSTPASRAPANKPKSRRVTLHLRTPNGRTRMAEIVSRSPRPSITSTASRPLLSPAANSNPENTSRLSLTPSSSFLSPAPTSPSYFPQPASSLLQSPTSTLYANGFTASPSTQAQPQAAPQWNLGAFRSYGPAPADSGADAALSAVSPMTEVPSHSHTLSASRSSSFDALAGNGSPAAVDAKPTLPSPASVSAQGPAEGGSVSMPPPPKPTLKIKLNPPKRMGSSDGSGGGGGGGAGFPA